MKIALLLSGDLRDFAKRFSSLYENILEPLSPDVYLSSYETDDAESVIEKLKPKKYYLEENNSFSVNEEIFLKDQPKHFDYIPKPINCVYMWRKIKQCFDLVSEHYDLIIRTRPDCHYTEKLDINKMSHEKINIPDGGDYEGGYFDMLSVANTPNMKVYCNLYDNILTYRKVGVPLHSEIMLRMHLRDMDINRFEFPVFLRDSQFNVKW